MDSEENHGFSQERLREIYVSQGVPIIQMPDNGPLLLVRYQGMPGPMSDDTVFYTVEVATGPKPRTLQDKFNDFFEDLTGYEPDDHPSKQYVEDMQDAFMAGAESNE